MEPLGDIVNRVLDDLGAPSHGREYTLREDGALIAAFYTQRCRRHIVGIWPREGETNPLPRVVDILSSIVRD